MSRIVVILACCVCYMYVICYSGNIFETLLSNVQCELKNYYSLLIYYLVLSNLSEVYVHQKVCCLVDLHCLLLSYYLHLLVVFD